MKTNQETPENQTPKLPDVGCNDLLAIEVTYKWDVKRFYDVNSLTYRQYHIPRLGDNVSLLEKRCEDVTEVSKYGTVKMVTWGVRNGEQTVTIFIS